MKLNHRRSPVKYSCSFFYNEIVVAEAVYKL